MRTTAPCRILFLASAVLALGPPGMALPRADAQPALDAPISPYDSADAQPALDAPISPYDTDDAPAAPVPVDADTPRRTTRAAHFGLDIEAVQGVLAVQRLDGWLLYDRQGQNPIALSLVAPAGGPTAHRWFYLIPAKGEAVALVHRAEWTRFEHVPGRKVQYGDYRELEKELGTMLRGLRHVAMEYSPRSALPGLSRVDAGTVELVRAQKRVRVRSSADLIQLSKSLWSNPARLSHHVAVHHLTSLRKAALAYVAEQIAEGIPVTEHDVQRFLLRGYEVRGLEGPPPVVAAGANAADPLYQPTMLGAASIKRGDLLLIDMAARVAGDGLAVYANTAWMAYVGERVPERLAKAFAAVAQARDAALALVQERVRRRRVIKGYEVDREARRVLEAAGYGEAFLHRTGHSLDTALQGGGANLDDYESRDTRALMVGAGFTIEPGIYIRGELGMRTSINVHIDLRSVDVTTPQQTEITAIL